MTIRAVRDRTECLDWKRRPRESRDPALRGRRDTLQSGARKEPQPTGRTWGDEFLGGYRRLESRINDRSGSCLAPRAGSPSTAPQSGHTPGIPSDEPSGLLRSLFPVEISRRGTRRNDSASRRQRYQPTPRGTPLSCGQRLRLSGEGREPRETSTRRQRHLSRGGRALVSGRRRRRRSRIEVPIGASAGAELGICDAEPKMRAMGFASTTTLRARRSVSSSPHHNSRR